MAACQSPSNEQADNQDTLRTEVADAEAAKPAEPEVEIDQAATARAFIMAGVELDNKADYDSILNSPEVQTHYKEFNEGWANLETTRLSKIRTWREEELAKFNNEPHNLFYPFSGPDFLNAYEFFPNCDNYLMFGLEPDGKLEDIQNLPPGYLKQIRSALAEIFQRNYFITSYMSGDLWGKGVLPLLNIFLARTNNQIVDIKRFYLERDGDGTPQLFDLEDEETGKGKLSGIMVEFLNKGKSKSQKIYYFGTDVADDKMQQKMGLVKFIRSFDNKMTFIKSASYILFNENFKITRDLVLETQMVLQDDTGVPYRVYKEKGWNVQLYGKYARPVADFQSYTYQSDLKQAFDEATNVKTLNFTYGYHWKTDNSSVLLSTPPSN